MVARTIIGNMLGCVLLSVMQVVANVGAIQLRVVSAEGRQIEHIVAGQPCLVEIIVPGSITVQHRPTIEGVDPAHIVREQESMRMYIINGSKRQERILSYLVHFMQAGDIRVGPAHVETPQGELLSNAVQLQVVKPGNASAAQAEPIRAQLHVGKKEAYVGEPVPYTVQFSYPLDAVQRVGLAPMDIQHGIVVPNKEVQRRIETRDGCSVQLLQWTGVLYPSQVGECVIPAQYFEYIESPHASSQSHWMQFMHMMGGFEHKQQNTQPVHLIVKPLPACAEHVCGVGSMQGVELAISAHSVAEGDSLTCTVRMTGDACADMVRLPALQVPDGFKVYESTVSIDGKYPHYTKTCEYIIHAVSAGKWEIPAQRYLFFDPVQKKYVECTTEVCTVEVTPSAMQKNDTTLKVDHDQQDVAAVPDDDNVPEGSVAPPHAAPAASYVLPWCWFLLGMMVPLLWCGVRVYVYALCRRLQRYIIIQRALRQGRIQLRLAVDQHNAYLFFTAWRAMLRQVIPCHDEELTDMFIVRYIQMLGFSEKESADWQHLWQQMSSGAFYVSDDRVLHDLLQRAYHCLDILKKYVRI